MKNKTVITAASAAFTAVAAALAESELNIKTTEYSLSTGRTGEEITAAVLSDLHFSVFGRDNSRLISRVRKISPDVIFAAGDFFDFHNGKSNAELAEKTLSALCDIADVYFTPGNHDLRFNIKTGEDYAEYAERAGCKIVNGNWFDAVIKGGSFRIGGVFDYASYPEDYGEEWKKSRAYEFLCDFSRTDSVKLLLMHRPNTFIYADETWDADAVFCGHTHGGIWQIPFVGGVYAPEQGVFPKYDKGEFTFGKTKMYLSSGLEGCYLIPRLFNRPEIMAVKIK